MKEIWKVVNGSMNKEMLLESIDIIRTVADHQQGLRKLIGKLLNKILYKYYEWI